MAKNYVIFKEFTDGRKEQAGTIKAASVIEARKMAFQMFKGDVLEMKYKVGAVTTSAWKQFS